MLVFLLGKDLTDKRKNYLVNKSMKGRFKTLLLLTLLFSVVLPMLAVEARQGCCSWHDGVCGCRCCDGTPLSAKCAPYYPSCGGGSAYKGSVYDDKDEWYQSWWVYVIGIIVALGIGGWIKEKIDERRKK